VTNQNNKTEAVLCALCNADDTETLREIPPWAYVQCRKCGLVYANERATEQAVQRVYEKNKFMSWFKKHTYKHRKMGNLKNIGDRLHRGEKLMYEVTKYKQGGRLLDIGCNRGFILANAAAWGWEAYGVEIVPWATKLVEKEFSVTAFNCRIRDVDPQFETGFFDAITMIDIIEHFHEPVKDMMEINRILKDDGFLIINTVDIGSAYARLRGYDWIFEKPEEHLYLFDKVTMKKILDKTGFKITSFCQSKGAPGEMEVHIQKNQPSNNIPIIIPIDIDKL